MTPYAFSRGDMWYVYTPTTNRFGTQDFEISRFKNPGISSRIDHDSRLIYLDDEMYCRVKTYRFQRHAFSLAQSLTGSVRLQPIELIVPKENWYNTLSYACADGIKGLSRDRIVSYLRSNNYRWTVNGMDVTGRNTVSAEYFDDCATAIFAHALDVMMCSDAVVDLLVESDLVARSFGPNPLAEQTAVQKRLWEPLRKVMFINKQT
ncbi:hypothetical protein BD408DRAFT_437620 [Parasitella parasitica]|nr:hypothetical protein BD408DRAFT_437620 [Parasitella parasitica]